MHTNSVLRDLRFMVRIRSCMSSRCYLGSVRLIRLVAASVIGLHLAASLGNLLNNGVIFDVVCVVCLHISSNAVQGPLESILRGRVHHAWLKFLRQLTLPTAVFLNSRIVAHHPAPMR
jgi:hypothetical protein